MNSHIDEDVYRNYVANSLQCIPQNKYIPTSYYDIIHKVEVDDRTGDEIAIEVITTLGLKFKED